MSKSVHDLLQEFASQTAISDDFQLHVLKVKITHSGEAEQVGNAQAVNAIEIDSDSQECLLHFAQSCDKVISVLEAKSVFAGVEQSFEVCVSEEKDTDDAVLRLDTPLIGFGENIETKAFFVVCQI